MSQNWNHTNEELIALLTGGEPGRSEGLKCLFLDEKLKHSAFKKIMAEGGSIDDARNSFQESFLIFNRSIAKGNYRGDSAPATYFIGICIQHWRDKQKLKSHKNTILVDDHLNLEVADPDGFESSFESQEIRQLAKRSLDLVKGECREILWMRANGLPHREIAEKLGILEDSVKNKVFRCNEALRAKLAEMPAYKLFIKNLLQWL